jgi:hypothetical protein
MPMEKFTLGNMPLLENGIVTASFDAELRRLVKDCDERPLDDKPRVLQMTVKLTPNPDVHGQHPVCDTVDVEVEITGKVPTMRTKSYAMKLKQDGTLAFHPDLPDDPDNETIMDEAERRRSERK